MEKAGGAVVVALLCAGSAAALDLEPARTTFEEGYAAVEARDLEKAKERFRRALDETTRMGAKDGQPDASTAIARTQIRFFAHYYLGTIASEERDTNRAAKHLESMLENESACGEKAFFVLPVPGSRQPPPAGLDTLDEAVAAMNSRAFDDHAKRSVLTRQRCHDARRRAYAFLSTVYRSARQHDRSADMLTRYIESKPTEGLDNALAARAGEYFLLRRFGEALADLDQVLARNARFAGGLALRCAVRVTQYKAGGEKDRALLAAADGDCQAAAKIEPSNAVAQDYAAEIAEHRDEARPGRKIADEDPGDPF
jgi:hypothetical protein